MSLTPLQRLSRRTGLLLACLLALTLASCVSRRSTPSDRPPLTTEIQWLGYQCFRIRTSLGTEILTNPFRTGSVPQTLPAEMTPDLLLITHEDPRVNNEDAVDNSPSILRGGVGVGAHTVRGIPIRGIRTSPNNLLFTFQVDRMIFCHPGALGSVLTDEQAREIGPVDVLFLPVDGGSDATAKAVLIGQLQPRIVIPMGTRAQILDWVGAYPRVHRLAGTSLLLNALTLPRAPTAVVFSTP